MRFAFTEDHLLFRTTVREFLEKECTPADVRAAWASASGWSTERWAKLATLGVTGLTVPEDHGGLGMDELVLVLVLEESGRAALPEPIVATSLRQMESPSPVWENNLATCSSRSSLRRDRRTGSNNVGITAASMPLPLSATAKSTRPGATSRALISTYP